MRTGKRVLFVAPNNLFGRTGGGLGMLSYYNAVKALYPSLVDLILPKECIKDAPNGEDVYLGATKRNNMIAMLELLKGSLHRFKKCTLNHLKKNHELYQLCIIGGGVFGGDMVDKIKSYGIKVAVIHLNYERDYHVDNKTILSFKGKCLYYIIRNEKNAYLKANVNFFMTSYDKQLFEDSYGESKGKAAMLGVYECVRNNLPLLKEKLPSNTLVITGAMNFYQTEYGIFDFYNNYYPLLKSKHPEYKVIMAGREPSEKIVAVARQEKDAITLIPNPENMEEVIEKGTIYFCPTCSGGGIKIKVMDGLRQGLPVLVHEVSARGYETYYDKPYFKIYNDIKTFEEGFSALAGLCKSDNIDRQQIQKDYESVFGFEAGVGRMKNGLLNI